MTPTQTTSLTNEEYRAVDAISKSDLDLAHKSPALLEWVRNAPSEPNDTADIGNALHCALLEPEHFANEYYEMPKFDKRTKAGKEQAAAFEQTMAGKTPIPDMVIAMRDSVLAHPVARDLLTSDGVSESSIFFEIDDIKCKCRPDRIVSGKHILVDVKTTDDIEKFHYSIRDYRYHVQAAFYSDGYAALTGEVPMFLFVVVGKRKVFGRHPVRVFALEQEAIDEGRAEHLADLDKVREYQQFGVGFDVEVVKMAKSWK